MLFYTEKNAVMCGNTTSIEVLVTSLEKRSHDQVTVRWICNAFKEVAIQNASQKRRTVKTLTEAHGKHGQQVSLLIQQVLDRLVIK